MSNKNIKIFEKTRIFWEKYEKKVMLSAGMILVAIISFEAGVLQGNKLEQKTLVIEKAVSVPNQAVSELKTAVLGAENEKMADKSKVTAQKASAGNNGACAFVGSKNSDKYHKPDCRWAKNIKMENIVCFKSEEEAKSSGYAGDKNCVK